MKQKHEQLEDIKELIRLKKIQEDTEKTKQMMAEEEEKKLKLLRFKYMEYSELTSEEMEKKANIDFPPTQVELKSPDHLDLIVQDYIKQFSKEPWFEKPVQEGDSVKLSFPTEKETVDFMLKQAELKRSFNIRDLNTNEILAYSDGIDGKLYHANGTEFKMGDSLIVPKPTTNSLAPKH